MKTKEERYATAWSLYQDPTLSPTARKTLEDEMDSAQNDFMFDEFAAFKQTLPGFTEHWDALRQCHANYTIAKAKGTA